MKYMTIILTAAVLFLAIPAHADEWTLEPELAYASIFPDSGEWEKLMDDEALDGIGLSVGSTLWNGLGAYVAYQYGSADNRYFDKIDVDFALTTFALGARYRYAFTGWFHAGAHLGVTLNYATLTFEDRYMKYEQESDSVGYDVGVDTAFMPFFNEAAWVRGFLFTLSLDYKTIPLSDMGELRDVSGFGVRVGAGYVFTFGEKPKEASAAPAIPPPAVPPAEKPAAPEPAPAVDSPR